MIAKLLSRTAQSALARYLFRPATNLLGSILDSRNKLIVNFQEPDQVRILDMVRQIKRERMFLLENHEAYQLASALIQTAKVPGDVIEVGVFQGGSAKLICELKNGKTLHLCDTFDGLPQPHTIDVRFARGSFNCPQESVRQYLAGYPGVHFHRGLFPESAPSLRDTEFSLAHLDVDLYASTLGCLEFLYPRMARGGVIISHDYTTAAGVQRAFDEFFAGKPDPILLLCGSQALVVKV